MSERLGPPVIRTVRGRPLHEEVAGDGMSLPHVATFAAIIGGASRTYYHERFDEAMRHSRENALAMRRDCFLMSLLQERTLAVSSLPWYLEVPDPNNPRQAKVRATLTQVLRGTRGFRRMVKAWLGAIWYGRYACQFSWRWREVDGRRCLAVHKWLPVNGDKIGHTWDGTPYVLVNAARAGSLPGAELVNTTRARALILQGPWRQRFVIHKHEIDDADYFEGEAGDGLHGVGVRSRVYWLDYLKREYLDWVVTYLERIGLGVCLWKYPAGVAGAKEEARRAAEDSSRRVNILVPVWQDGRGTAAGGLERIEVPTGGVEVLRSMMDALDAYIERYIVGQSGSANAQSSGIGNEAASEFMSSTKDAIRDDDANLLAESITGDEEEPGLISMMQAHSFPETTPDRPDGFPVMLRFGLERTLNNQRVQTIQTVTQMGLPVRKDDVYNAAGLSRPEPHDDVLEPQQPGGGLGGMPGGGGAPGQPVAEGEPGGDPGEAQASPEDVDAFLAELGLGGEGGEQGGDPGDEPADPDDVEGLLAELFGGGQPVQHGRRGRPRQYAWVRDPKYQGTQGGKWRNDATGEVRYQEHEPGTRGHAETDSPEAPQGGGITRKQLAALRTKLKAEGLLDKLRGLFKKREKKGYEDPAPPERRDVQLGEQPQRRSKARVKFNVYQPDAEAMVKRLFGPDATPQAVAEAIGAPDDATVYIEHVGEFKKGYLEQLDVDAVGVRVTVEHPGIKKMMRFVGIDANGRRFVYNEEIELKGGSRGGDLMMDIFMSQIEAASAAGIDCIVADAARDGEKNGYYTWPRYGYDFPLDSPHVPEGSPLKKVLQEAAAKFDAKTILDVMATKEGQDWWRANGATLWAATFDLSTSGRSIPTLIAYQRERKQRPPK